MAYKPNKATDNLGWILVALLVIAGTLSGLKDVFG